MQPLAHDQATRRTSKDEKRRQATVLAKLDVCVQPIADHDGSFGVKVDPAKVSQPAMEARNKKGAYFAWILSSMVVDGFPQITGTRCIAHRRGALIEPAPGSNPCALG